MNDEYLEALLTYVCSSPKDEAFLIRLAYEMAASSDAQGFTSQLAAPEKPAEADYIKGKS